MCFCRYNIESMYEKYKAIHPDEALSLTGHDTVHDWVSAVGGKALGHDGQTLLLLYKLNLMSPEFGKDFISISNRNA